jgi:hypothetical protein
VAEKGVMFPSLAGIGRSTNRKIHFVLLKREIEFFALSSPIEKFISGHGPLIFSNLGTLGWLAKPLEFCQLRFRRQWRNWRNLASFRPSGGGKTGETGKTGEIGGKTGETGETGESQKKVQLRFRHLHQFQLLLAALNTDDSVS